ncbi:hypothetical protein GGTG_14403 [Gaeumannomyces tritici R3-111a-1]|uniref:N-acetyltransferase domain-containing protein n=1 Tax=Gaeumannomyces tritici (strain R3-111a-1) TaxID=644352 RepID=J3PLD7_GAET3|nr:hypothetical protein GGTG_14403 [Gaeumannomyces tritici R3-111a-1]EJT68019.1 hypothetical protein GGTG_14403 [Gaeumannomyces tritici R3-111a-1]
MERRKAEPGDLLRLVEITVISMPDDVTYLYEWPLHSIYPGVMESIWEFRLKKLLSKCHVIVENGNVIAFAIWTQESHFPAEQRDECPPEDLAEKFKLVGSRTDVFEKGQRVDPGQDQGRRHSRMVHHAPARNRSSLSLPRRCSDAP